MKKTDHKSCFKSDFLRTHTQTKQNKKKNQIKREYACISAFSFIMQPWQKLGYLHLWQFKNHKSAILIARL